ncbi:PAS domain-containing sensor histidine kinase [Rufibacter roseus]|uniref:histidine kinase n=1 Tax=Rufibacter roseus TaxID=1567108 RepID=A0ABW2DRT2_9BACT|nr:PAS domain S-box protein [Rufibacter roseus]
MSEEKNFRHGMAHDFSLLRQEAQKLQKPVSMEDVQNMPDHEIRRLIQELQIHQVELEMQNHQLQQATQELEVTKAKYQNLYHYSPFGYVTLDEHGIIEEANEKGMQLLSAKREQLESRRFSQFIHSDSLDAYYGFFRKVLLSETVQTVELQILTNIGTVFYAQLEGQLLRRENDTDQCRVAFVDVTERKTAHIALSNKENMLSAIINSSLNAIQVFKAVRNSEGTIIDFEWLLLNRTAELFLDHTLEQLHRSRLTDILPSTVTEGHLATFMQVVENGLPATFTAHFKKEEQDFWLNCVAVKLEDGFVLTFEDVTQQRIANEKLQESQLLLKKMAEAMPDFLYVEDLLQHRNIYNNRDFLAFLGYSKADIKNHPRDLLDTLYHPEDAHLLFDRPKRFEEVEDGVFLESHVRVLAKDGSWRNIYFRETVFKRGASGKPTQLVGTAQDITEKLRAEREIRQLNETVTAILQNLPVTLWRFGKDGHVRESRGAGLKALGLQEHQMIGQTFAPVHNELERHITKALEGNKINTLAEFDIEGRQVYKQVYLFQESLTGEAIGFCLDVTHQKQAEVEAQRQTMLLNQILQNIPMVLALIDQNGYYVEARGKGLRSLGLQDHELNGKNVFDLFPFLKDNISDILEGQVKSFSAHFPYQGKRVHFQNFGFLDPQRNMGIAFGLDVTELKEMQEKLLTEKEFSENLLENSIDGILAFDPDMNVTAWNKTMEEIMAKKKADVLGKPLLSLFQKEQQAYLRHHLTRVLNGERITTYQSPVLGNNRSYEINLVPFFNPEKEVIGALAILHDVTLQQKRQKEETKTKLDKQKAVANAVISAQEEERKRIAEALHNSLAQLLYAAKLNLENFEASYKGKNGDPLHRISAFLEDAIKETRSLAHELIPRALQDFGLKTALKELAQRLSTPYLTVQCVVTGFDLSTDYVLETHLYRMVQELLNNVMKHANATEALVQVTDKGPKIMVRVEDNGKGMKLTDKVLSKGMGLATIKNQAKLLKGTMHIHSVIGEGTIITVELIK